MSSAGRSWTVFAALLSPIWVSGAAEAPPARLPDVLLTRQLVEARGLSPGAVVLLSSHPTGIGAREFRLVGSYEPLPDPLKLAQQRFEARLHLPDLIDLTAGPDDPGAAEAVTRVNLALVDPSGAFDLPTALAARVPGVAVSSTAGSPQGTSLFAVLERFHTAVAVITLIGSTAFLLALMVIRVDERRETLAILRLLGLSRSRILANILCEGVLISVLGAFVGILIAWGAEGLFNRFFQWRYDTTLVFIRVTPEIALRCVLLSVPLGVLAGTVASWGLLCRGILALLRR